MLMNEVTLNTEQTGQREPNEKVGSFINVLGLFFFGGEGGKE